MWILIKCFDLCDDLKRLLACMYLNLILRDIYDRCEYGREDLPLLNRIIILTLKWSDFIRCRARYNNTICEHCGKRLFDERVVCLEADEDFRPYHTKCVPAGFCSLNLDIYANDSSFDENSWTVSSSVVILAIVCLSIQPMRVPLNPSDLISN